MAYSTQLTQDQAYLKLDHPLEQDLFNLRHIQVIEAMDEPFEITAQAVSEKPDIDYKQLIGKEVTFTLDIEGDPRYFHGVVGSFKQYATPDPNTREVTWYELKVYPKMWLLKLATDCRVYQDQTPLAIIEQVLKEHGITDFRIQCTQCGTTPREYCVQYNETHFNFIARLMEEEGIFYYFKHEHGKHILILGDKPTAHELAAGAERVEYEQATPAYPLLNVVTSCDPKHKVVSLAHGMADYNMTIASTKLFSLLKNNDGSVLPGSQQEEARADGFGASDATRFGENFTYPGQVDHEDIPTQERLEHLTRLRLEEMESGQSHIEGTSTVPYFMTGFKFALTKHHRADLNKTYVLRRVIHEISSSFADSSQEARTPEDIPDYLLYTNRFEAFEDTTTYRPARKTPRPKIESIQSAIVTGPKGEEIWTDHYGRIKVQFKWDRRGKFDEKSSCWVRVLQGWGGNNWGVLFTPRIDMEVMVTFLDGDPSRPLVTGCLYNSDHMPPYLPERVTNEMSPTKSTIKSNSSKGGDGFNEIRYEDKKDEEQVYFRAQKDFDSYIIENVTTHIAKGSIWTSVDNGDRDVALYGQGQAKAKETPRGQAHPQGKGDDNLEITTGNRNISFLSGFGSVLDSYYMKAGDYAYLNDKGSQSFIQVEGNYYRTLVKGNHDTVIDTGNHSLFIDQGEHHTTIQTGKRAFEINKGNDDVHIHTGDQLTYIETGDQKTLIDKGNVGLTIGLGNKVQNLHEGNYKVTLDKGDHSLTIGVGNMSIVLSKGDKTESINGNYTGTVNENYTLTILGNLDIVCKGAISVQSGKSISFNAAESISLTAGEAIAMDAGGDISLSTAANAKVTSLQNTSVKATGAIELTSVGETSLEATAGFTLSSAAITMEAMTGGINMTSAGGIETESLSATTIVSPSDITLEGTAVSITACSFSVAL
jgi:type VI secretion system Vgr family protein